ncbi:MAG: lysine--tRNA ligase [bacterium]|nr:lysine--tRNA ligase [bacterium]
MTQSGTSQDEHWADRVAADVIEAGRDAVVSTGISPSGEIHIGNMREILTGDAVFRALLDRGASARFNYVADNFDPLRKSYDFLDAKIYEPLVGRPLSDIPCPCGGHDSYSEHFLEPFLAALRELRVDVEVERADGMYRSGRMTPWIVRSLQNRDRIAAIFKEVSGQDVAEDWYPFNPLCAECKRLNSARVTGFSAEDETVDYTCACGSSGTVPMAGGGKLVWKVDWPARWMMLGVTVEPFGKDHASRGGSYDIGKRVVGEVFGGEAPHPIPYEWISLKGKGDMSSSKGNVLSIHRMLEVVPPDVLRFLVIRQRPQKAIKFDPGLPLLQLVDQVDSGASAPAIRRSLELSQAAGFAPLGVPFKHLVVVAQASSFDVDRALDILRRSGYPDVRREALEPRMIFARSWLDSFAPAEMRFTVQSELPRVAGELDEQQKKFLGRLGRELTGEMGGDDVHKLVYSIAEEFSDSKPARLFEAIYVSLLGQTRGPRAGWFIVFLGAEFCANRFLEAALEEE